MKVCVGKCDHTRVFVCNKRECGVGMYVSVVMSACVWCVCMSVWFECECVVCL